MPQIDFIPEEVCVDKNGRFVQVSFRLLTNRNFKPMRESQRLPIAERGAWAMESRALRRAPACRLKRIRQYWRLRLSLHLHDFETFGI
jgi:hypothetical protein